MFDKIIHPTSVLSVAGEAIASLTAGGALAATNLAQTEIVPGTVSLSDGTNTFTDSAGNGVLTGAPGGTGTINYRTGIITITGGAASAALTGAYDHFNPAASEDTNFANAVTPQFMSFRSDGAAGGLLILASSDGTNFEQFHTRAEGAWWHSDVGLVPLAWLRVLSASKGRLIGRPVNPT